ncbi:MAG: hypothetical protein R2798_05075 [Chitinophagales bacterium]|nr:hypothetical protein [Bacteroidota bacterium]MCB9042714.1 hypothetical protein [Chitinophagales bacterium]
MQQKESLKNIPIEHFNKILCQLFSLDVVRDRGYDIFLRYLSNKNKKTYITYFFEAREPITTRIVYAEKEQLVPFLLSKMLNKYNIEFDSNLLHFSSAQVKKGEDFWKHYEKAVAYNAQKLKEFIDVSGFGK